MLTHIDLFSGIGGFALAAQWAGFRTVAFVEIDEYCGELLRQNFPGVPIFGDIRDLTGEQICREIVQTVNHGQSHRIGPIVSRAIQSESQIGALATSSDDRRPTESGASAGRAESSTITAAHALAAEKERESFYASITNSTTATASGKPIAPKRGSWPSREGYRTTIKSSATTATTPEAITGNVRIDLLTAGVPCQPASQAGKQRGSQDDRWLWPEAFRLVRELHPQWCIFENVPGILALERGLEFERLLVALEEAGYSVWPLVIPACAVDAKHRRDRVWIVGHAKERTERTGLRESEQGRERRRRSGYSSGEGDALDAGCALLQGRRAKWLPEPDVGRVANGIPARVDRLKGLGNAIVPQVVFEIVAQIAIIEHGKKEV